MSENLPSRREFLVSFVTLGLAPVFLRLPREKPDYTEPVFAHCPYQIGNVTALSYRDHERRKTVVVEDVEPALSSLLSWQGRNIWLGYPDEVPEDAPSGFDMPEDVGKIGTIKLRLKENKVNSKKILDDYTEIWLFTDDKEVYVLPFVSLTVEFARADGEYSGYHLCGAYAIPTETFAEFTREVIS